MKTNLVTRYGDPSEVIRINDLAMPKPKEKQVLVKVMAATVNDYDWSATSGKPHSYRLLFGLTKPRKRFRHLGMELAGTIEEVGPGVTRFKVGDKVYGDTSNHQFGALSEYMCVHEEALFLKSDHMSYVEAAAIPHAGMLAYEGLLDMGEIQPEQHVLINGGGGGMGTLALQIAKNIGAEVTGVDSAHKFGMMQDLGFDHMIDYKTTDFTENGIQYDLILDAKTSRAPWKFLKSLKPSGKYVSVGGKSANLLQLFIFGGMIKTITGKSVRILALEPNKYLEKANKMYEEGVLKPVIDGPYTLDELPRLVKYFGEGRHKGKIVISMESNHQ